MNPIRKLIGQTAVYGLSTILARTANYLVLTPLYTYVFTNQEDFGINTEIYAYISFLNIILTYGMETAFFNFYSKQENKQSIYSTALISLLISTSVILITGTIFSNTISSLMGYEGRENFIVWMFLIICSDALMVIPFARLRSENKAARFAMIKTLNILINIICNVFFIIICKNQHEVNPDSFLGKLYD
ncbi:MAG: lipopolysaccharide biosynthesis protein, partial [Bacteroidota bacterium]